MRLQLHDAIYRPDFFVLMLLYCANLKDEIQHTVSWLTSALSIVISVFSIVSIDINLRELNFVSKEKLCFSVEGSGAISTFIPGVSKKATSL